MKLCETELDNLTKHQTFWYTFNHVRPGSSRFIFYSRIFCFRAKVCFISTRKLKLEGKEGFAGGLWTYCWNCTRLLNMSLCIHVNRFNLKSSPFQGTFHKAISVKSTIRGWRPVFPSSPITSPVCLLLSFRPLSSILAPPASSRHMVSGCRFRRAMRGLTLYWFGLPFLLGAEGAWVSTKQTDKRV